MEGYWQDQPQYFIMGFNCEMQLFKCTIILELLKDISSLFKNVLRTSAVKVAQDP